MTFPIRYDEWNLPFWRWKVSSCSGQLRAVRCAAPSCVCLVFARGCIDPAARSNWRYLANSSTSLAFYGVRSRSTWVPVIATVLIHCYKNANFKSLSAYATHFLKPNKRTRFEVLTAVLPKNKPSGTWSCVDEQLVPEVSKDCSVSTGECLSLRALWPFKSSVLLA